MEKLHYFQIFISSFCSSFPSKVQHMFPLTSTINTSPLLFQANTRTSVNYIALVCWQCVIIYERKHQDMIDNTCADELFFFNPKLLRFSQLRRIKFRRGNTLTCLLSLSKLYLSVPITISYKITFVYL